MRSPCAVFLAVALTVPKPAAAQHSWGLAGVLSDRIENAFGVGGSLTIPIPKLEGRAPIGDWSPRWGLRVYGIVDLEFTAGELVQGICRYDEPDGGFYYYRRCDTHDPVQPFDAEAASKKRIYSALYVVGDLWRIRAGAGLASHPFSGEFLGSALVGFAMSQHFWTTLEVPQLKGWRLRAELQLGAPHLW